MPGRGTGRASMAMALGQRRGLAGFAGDVSSGADGPGWPVGPTLSWTGDTADPRSHDERRRRPAGPFVAAVVDCDGTRVRANMINVPPDPRQVRVGMPVRLATYSLGTDAQGVEAIGFGFEPTQQED